MKGSVTQYESLAWISLSLSRSRLRRHKLSVDSPEQERKRPASSDTRVYEEGSPCCAMMTVEEVAKALPSKPTAPRLNLPVPPPREVRQVDPDLDAAR